MYVLLCILFSYLLSLISRPCCRISKPEKRHWSSNRQTSRSEEKRRAHQSKKLNLSNEFREPQDVELDTCDVIRQIFVRTHRPWSPRPSASPSPWKNPQSRSLLCTRSPPFRPSSPIQQPEATSPAGHSHWPSSNSRRWGGPHGLLGFLSGPSKKSQSTCTLLLLLFYHYCYDYYCTVPVLCMFIIICLFFPVVCHARTGSNGELAGSRNSGIGKWHHHRTIELITNLTRRDNCSCDQSVACQSLSACDSQGP